MAPSFYRRIIIGFLGIYIMQVFLNFQPPIEIQQFKQHHPMKEILSAFEVHNIYLVYTNLSVII